VIKYKRTQKT